MKRRHVRQTGFTLIEVLIVLLLMSIIMGAIFTQISTAQKRSTAEQAKVELFQEAREFMDQLTRDLRNAGYPNKRNYGPGVSITDSTNAVGLTHIGNADVWFEGDVEGVGTVSVVKYHYEPNGENCPCLQRSEVIKSAGTADNYSVEVQNLQNGTAENPIFEYYDTTGAQILPSTLPLDNTTTVGRQKLASVAVIKINMSVQARYADLQTGLRPIVTLVSTAHLENCSQAVSSQGNSC